ncbi:MAG: GPR endopeptidase [Oscillospiraceae bacterium]|jgi:spore protease|nr:GPR endopeptidase [Oscillospiraceae bacterium]
MEARTDLAVESLDFAGDLAPEGVAREVFRKNGVEVTRVRVTSAEGAKRLGKPQGEYLTIDTDDFKAATGNFAIQVDTIAELIAPLIPQEAERPVLVAGLGNLQITPDALGPRAVRYTLATRHISRELAEEIGLSGLRPVAVIATGVLGQTGIETAELVASVAEELKPSCVIVIDALAARSVDRLATTVQISNTGISPGSGVQNRRKELSRETLGVPVVSVGVPMVVDMATVACDMLGAEAGPVSEKGRTMMVTPREIDLAVEHAAKTVAFAINRALQPHLSLEDLTGLVG